jgi:hypothetical protein
MMHIYKKNDADLITNIKAAYEMRGKYSPFIKTVQGVSSLLHPTRELYFLITIHFVQHGKLGILAGTVDSLTCLHILFV